MILIIDNQSLYIRVFEKKLIKRAVPYKFYYHSEQIDFSLKDQVSGIILSGGAGNPYEPLNLTANYVALNNFDVPIIGLCLGFEIIAVFYGGTISILNQYQNGFDHITILNDDPIFAGVSKKIIRLKEQHQYKAETIPDSCVNLASSGTCQYEIIRHKDKPIYGFQSHPEVSGQTGDVIMGNFIEMCGHKW